jgi:DNA recombination protein RmuC
MGLPFEIRGMLGAPAVPFACRSFEGRLEGKEGQVQYEFLWMVAIFVLGVILGAAFIWTVTRSRELGVVEAAVLRAEASVQGQLAQLRERAETLERLREDDRARAEDLRREAKAMRDELDASRNEVARLSERAARVDSLDEHARNLQRTLEERTAELRRISNEGAQSAEALKLQTERVRDLESQAAASHLRASELTDRIEAANTRNATLAEQAASAESLAVELTNFRSELNLERDAHAASRSRIAALEAQASRVVPLESSLAESRQDRATITQQLADLRAESATEIAGLKSVAQERDSALANLRVELDGATRAREELSTALNSIQVEHRELQTRLQAEREGFEARMQDLLAAKEALTDQFKALAGEILEEKAKRFTQQNQENIGQLLTPLKTQLAEFKNKVEEVYVNEGKDRSALAEQVRSLMSLNQTLSQEANNLTKALKNESKTQGNWGELILERVLEASGLKKGLAYQTQETQRREDGSQGRPDVVIRLPEERNLVVDSKVSLVAYEQFVFAETDEDRAVALRRHLESVRGHVKNLSGKEYQLLYGLKSLDFVLMFVPIEPAFMAAVTNDSELFMDAWEKNVLLVSPSTLLFVIRTVAHLWRQEDQSRNAMEIAKRGAELYDRLSDFVKDLDAIGNSLQAAQKSFDSAHKRLSTGRGNVIRQAEMLKTMGVKPTKVMPASFADTATEHEDAAVVDALAARALENTPSDAIASGSPK